MKKGYDAHLSGIGAYILMSLTGGQPEYVRVPFADQGLNKIPEGVSDRQALFVGDVLATGYWAARISEIANEDTVLIIGAGPTGIFTLLCVMLKNPKCIIICEKDEERIRFINENYPDMYGKNLTFKTGGVDGCDCEETLKLIAEGKIDTEPLITHTYPLSQIEEVYEIFENKRFGVIKIAIEC